MKAIHWNGIEGPGSYMGGDHIRSYPKIWRPTKTSKSLKRKSTSRMQQPGDDQRHDQNILINFAVHLA